MTYLKLILVSERLDATVELMFIASADELEKLCHFAACKSFFKRCSFSGDVYKSGDESFPRNMLQLVVMFFSFEETDADHSQLSSQLYQ
jgi:nicotinic acid mononucleotide adenylyltransferase